MRRTAPLTGRHTRRARLRCTLGYAFAETIIGLYKTGIIYRRGPWCTLDAVECAALEWVDWFNDYRLLKSIGKVPPAELEMAYIAVGHDGLTQP